MDEHTPSDTTLPPAFLAAVERMTVAAQAAHKDRLVLSPEAWRTLIQPYFTNPDMMSFSRDIVQRVGNAVDSLEELNRWMALATDIWNNTPQPDRGGKTANELLREHR